MLIPYEVFYEAAYVLKGGKRSTSRLQSFPAEADVAETTADDAPIVARWKKVEGGATFLPEVIRFHWGRFYEPFPEWLKRNGPTDARATAVEYVGQRKIAKDASHVGADIAYRLGDTRNVKAEEARMRADSLLLVDGTLHIRCSQPRMVLDLRHDDSELSIAKVIHGTTHGFRPEPIHVQRIVPLVDETKLLDAASAHGGRLWRRFDDLEIVSPEHLLYDEASEACGRVVEQAICDNQTELHRWPTTVAVEFLDIRERYRKWQIEPDGIDIADLLDRLFAVFTEQDIYHHQRLADFLANYETVQDNRPEAEVVLPIHRTPRAEP